MLMTFIKELKRYWYINLKDYKKSLIPILVNFVVVLMCYILMKKNITETYLVAYSIVWILLTTQMGLMQEFLLDVKAKRIKYFFIGKRSLVHSYYARYTIGCVKYSMIYYIFIKFAYYVGVVQYNIKFYEVALLCIGLCAIFFINYVLSLLIVLNRKLQTAINLLKCIVFYFIISNNSILLPLSYVIHNLGNNFLKNKHFGIYDVVIIMINSIIYIFIGYYICYRSTKFVKYKLVE